MIIRIAGHEDSAGIAAVVHAMTELTSISRQPVEVTAESILSNLERISSSDSSSVYLAEEASGEVVGYGVVHWTPFLFLRGGEAYVTELFVKPDASGKGIGSGILGLIRSEALRRGCSRISLLNGRDGESYHREFYKKHGWIERDYMANFILPLTDESKQPADAS